MMRSGIHLFLGTICRELFVYLNYTISGHPLTLPHSMVLNYMGDYIWLEEKCPDVWNASFIVMSSSIKTILL